MPYRWKKITVGALLLSSVGVALPGCLLEFASLSDNDRRVEILATTTYAELWDRLADHATDHVVAAVIKSGDPFHIPESPLDLFQLERNLLRFKDLLEQSRGNTESVRKKFLDLLSQRLAARGRAREKQEIEKAKSRRESYDFNSLSSSVAVSPDNRYIVYYRDGVAATNDITFVDTSNGKVNLYSTEGLKSQYVNYVPDGTGLYYAAPGLRLEYVPVKDGVPDFKSRKMIGDAEPNNRIAYLFHPGVAPGEVYGSDVNLDSGVYRYHFSTAQRLTIPFAGVLKPDERVTNWGTLPNRAGVYLTTENPKKNTAALTLYRVEADGTLSSPEMLSVWESNTGHGTKERRAPLHINPNGSWYYHTGREVKFADGTNHVSKAAFESAPPSTEATFSEVIPRPGTSEIAIFFKDSSTGESWLQFLNYETGERRGNLRLPAYAKGGEIQFSKDGTRVFIPVSDPRLQKLFVFHPESVTR